MIGAFAVSAHGLPRATGDLVPVLGRAELIANKEAAGRPQDLADVARLRAADAG